MSKIQCLTCGGMTEVGEALSGTCEYCGCRVEFKRIASFNAVPKVDLGKLKSLFDSGKKQDGKTGESGDLGTALCYLLTGNFILAKKKLAALIDASPENAEAYYYYALSLVNGRSLSEITMREARQITEYLQTAMAMDEKFLFPKLFYALLCLEYYEANDLCSPDDGEALLNSLAGENVDSGELAFFKSAVYTEMI